MAIDPDLDPIIADLKKADSDLADGLAGHSRSIEKVELVLAELAARVAKMEHDGLPQPTPTKATTFGVTRSAYDQRGSAGLALPGVVRDFTSGGVPLSTTIRKTVTLGIPLWYSWKPDLLSATWHSTVEATLRTAMAGVTAPLFIAVWHEPEGSTDAGGGTVAAKSQRWRDAHSRLHAIALKLRSEKIPVYVAPIICDWTFWDTSKGTPQAAWYPETWKDYDVQGYDVYPQGNTGSGSTMIARLRMTADYVVSSYADPARNDTYKSVRLCSDWAARCGKPWGSGETGVIRGAEVGGDTQYKYTTKQRAQRFTEIANDLASLALPPLLWCWYNDGGCNITSEPDRDSVAAWGASFSKNPSSIAL